MKMKNELINIKNNYVKLIFNNKNKNQSFDRL